MGDAFDEQIQGASVITASHLIIQLLTGTKLDIGRSIFDKENHSHVERLQSDRCRCAHA